MNPNQPPIEWRMQGTLTLKDQYGTLCLRWTKPEDIRALMAEQQARADRLTRDNQRLQDYLNGKYTSDPEALRG